MRPHKEHCRGMIVDGSACENCERCTEEAKVLVARLQKLPLKDIAEKDIDPMTVSCFILARVLGPEGLNHFLKTGESPL